MLAGSSVSATPILRSLWMAFDGVLTKMPPFVRFTVAVGTVAIPARRLLTVILDGQLALEVIGCDLPRRSDVGHATSRR
jgi:hypothetical protein